MDKSDSHHSGFFCVLTDLGMEFYSLGVHKMLMFQKRWVTFNFGVLPTSFRIACRIFDDGLCSEGIMGMAGALVGASGAGSRRAVVLWRLLRGWAVPVQGDRTPQCRSVPENNIDHREQQYGFKMHRYTNWNHEKINHSETNLRSS